MCIPESKQVSEVENSADKFLKSILGNGMFDSPVSPKPDSPLQVTFMSLTCWQAWHGWIKVWKGAFKLADVIAQECTEYKWHGKGLIWAVLLVHYRLLLVFY